MKRITFQSLCRELREKPSFNEVTNELKILADAVALFTGHPSAGVASLFLETLSQKDKLAKTGGAVRNKIIGQSPKGFSGRVEQMQEAYGMICFTAFFDELDACLPDDIRDSIQLNLQEEQEIYLDGLYSIGEGPEALAVSFPTLLHGCSEQDNRLKELYEAMCQGLRKLVEGLSFWESIGKDDKNKFVAKVCDLPKEAIRRFHDYYLYLCGKFNEFYVFTQLEQEKYQKMCWDKRYEDILSLALGLRDSTQAGMAALAQAVVNQQKQVKKESVQKIVDTLVSTYQRAVERPLIETKGGEEQLTYPRISKAFIPQAYKLLEYSGMEQLGPPETWEKLKLRQDMESFWAKYLLDPSSTDRLLLILGEPGSGKSLLTKVLCARLISLTDIFVRIPFREHDMEEEIEYIICRQLEKDGDAVEKIQKFKWFAEEFPDRPITLLFDGYDEVLQATGGVYRNLLEDLLNFQKRCREFRRPVRVVVTSRATLIDKAYIPEETIVMKLLEFDVGQKAQWIEIWNQHNHDALSRAGIRDFALPVGSVDIEELSKQPLLLMMLAIYDANFEQGTNALIQKIHRLEGLDRTGLYDELLRRFIRRELQKEEKSPQNKKRSQKIFNEEFDPWEQADMADKEMRRLGVAALGMLAREKLSIRVEELEADLSYMEVKKPTFSPAGKKPLRDAESLFGSFFFIHDSRTEHKGREPETAYEFLHKTFYEFLIADLTLRCLIDAADGLYRTRKDTTQGVLHYQKALTQLDEFPKAYYAVLSGAYLCAEPETIHMMAEWAGRKLDYCFSGNHTAFGQVMEDILTHHTTLLRKGQFALPEERPGWLPIDRLSPQTHATYFMNLLVMQVLIMGRIQIGLDNWRYLSQFVRLNAIRLHRDPNLEARPVCYPNATPSEELILRFMSLFQICREGNVVILQKRNQSRDFVQESLLEVHMDLADFMQDDVAGTFYKLHSSGVPARIKRDYRQELYNQGFDDFKFELGIAQVKAAILSPAPQDYPIKFVESGAKSLEAATEEPANVLEWMACLYQLVCKTVSPVRPESRRYAKHKGTKRFSVWCMLGEVIFTKYISQKELVLLYIALLRQAGYQDVLLNGRYIGCALFYLPSVLPELVDTMLELGCDNVHYPLITAPWERLAALSEISLKAMAALLRYLYLSGQLSDFDPVWDKLTQNWIIYIRKWPREFRYLLQVYIRAGRFDEIRDFFQHMGDRLLPASLYQYPEVQGTYLDTLIDAAQTVGEEAALCEYLARSISKNPGLPERSPRVFFRLIYYAASDSLIQVDKEFWVQFFLRHYQKFFDGYPVETVQLLIRIFEHESPEKAEIVDVYTKSLRRFQLILDRSVEAAAQLIAMIEKMDEEDKQKIFTKAAPPFQYDVPVNCAKCLSYYIRLCFDSALSVCDKGSASQLAKLLSIMGDTIKGLLAEYFQGQLCYIKAYSDELAEKVKEIYQISC